MALEPSSAKVIWFSWQEFPNLLQRRQQLGIYPHLFSVELHRGRQILAQVVLPPIPYRLLVILILARGQTVSYGKLLAAEALSEAAFWSILEHRSLEQEDFLQEITRQQQQLQVLQSPKAREARLRLLRKHVRGAQGVTNLLADSYFPWTIEASHTLGYRLVRVDSDI